MAVVLVVDGEVRVDADERAYLRSRRAQKPWNVPTQTRELRHEGLDALAHLAGRLVGEGQGEDLVRPGCPTDSRWATRRVMTRVLPEPAPARTRSGPSMWVTASRWAAVRSASKSIFEPILGRSAGLDREHKASEACSRSMSCRQYIGKLTGGLPTSVSAVERVSQWIIVRLKKVLIVGDITYRSNLFALNAAIEAAQGPPAGRGSRSWPANSANSPN